MEAGKYLQDTVSQGQRELPALQKSERHRFVVGGLKGYLKVSIADEQPVEIFLNVGKHGTTVAGLCNTIAIVTSLGLRQGVPLEALCRALMGVNFEPSGMTNNTEIRTASSVVDYVFRWLQWRFLEAGRGVAPETEKE